MVKKGGKKKYRAGFFKDQALLLETTTLITTEPQLFQPKIKFLCIQINRAAITCL